jgi:hypothetical protein
MKFFPTLKRKLATTNSAKQALVALVVAEIHSVGQAALATYLKHSLAEHHHLVAVNADLVDHHVVKTSKQLQTLHLKKRCLGVRQQ